MRKSKKNKKNVLGGINHDLNIIKEKIDLNSLDTIILTIMIFVISCYFAAISILKSFLITSPILLLNLIIIYPFVSFIMILIFLSVLMNFSKQGKILIMIYNLLMLVYLLCSTIMITIAFLVAQITTFLSTKIQICIILLELLASTIFTFIWVFPKLYKFFIFSYPYHINKDDELNKLGVFLLSFHDKLFNKSSQFKVNNKKKHKNK